MQTSTDGATHPAPGTYWDDFQTGVSRAEHELCDLAADVLLLPRIVAEPATCGLDTAGKLAGYLARVSEALRHDDEPPRAPADVKAPPAAVDHWFVGLAQADARISDCCHGTEGMRPTVVVRLSDDAAGRKAAARVIELLSELDQAGGRDS
ncbi:hypothetical protein [Elioraea sp.]|uniref:hypothetical protein n=1 Tax=Elioraea sp. TaxID=2185103 RepID=UPI0021DDEBBE|nr:hypothetical protein [Elioraea sp.]GIX10342.1 MAG: hypothetical protein KatS3mg116_2052 [Elioraea sp.]